MRVAGLLLNLLALIPAVVVTILIVVAATAAKEAIREQEAHRQEEQRKAAAEQRQREAELLAAARKHEAEAERLRQQTALKEQEARLLEQRRQRQREEEERRALREEQRQQEETRRKAEQETKEEAAREVVRKAELEKKAKEEAAREAARKAELEEKGLPYYPRSLTLYEEHNAQEWYQLLRDRPNDARLWRQGIKALVALKEEGMSFLLDHLSRQTTFKDRDASLRLIHVEYVHPNDLHKLLPCLDQTKAFPATRMHALNYLQMRAKDLNKRLVPEIESLVEDMLTSSKQREETKEEIRSMLKTIRTESK